MRNRSLKKKSLYQKTFSSHKRQYSQPSARKPARVFSVLEEQDKVFSLKGCFGFKTVDN